MKICSDCHIEKPLSAFNNLKKSKDGKAWRCADCNLISCSAWSKRNPNAKMKNYLVKAYGITFEDKVAMSDKQQNRCAICNTHQTQLKQTLAVDHDHKTGKIRELLCNNCNNALGRIKDSFELAIGLAKYLQKHQDII